MFSHAAHLARKIIPRKYNFIVDRNITTRYKWVIKEGDRQMTNATNMPYAVYRCDLIGPGNRTPKNEVLISGHVTLSEAMDAANKAKRADRKHSYSVGAA
jgi:hypothetical protein